MTRVLNKRILMGGLNKYQLQEELKKALHNRKQEHAKFLCYEDFLTIEYDEKSDWIYADWRGYQTESSVNIGCEKMCEALRSSRCSKILNDNTNVLGIWMPASAWIGGTWLDRLKEAGLNHFAWVYSQGTISRVSMDESIRGTNFGDIVQIFDNTESAERWLKSR